MRLKAATMLPHVAPATATRLCPKTRSPQPKPRSNQQPPASHQAPAFAPTKPQQPRTPACLHYKPRPILPTPANTNQNPPNPAGTCPYQKDLKIRLPNPRQVLPAPADPNRSHQPPPAPTRQPATCRVMPVLPSHARATESIAACLNTAKSGQFIITLCRISLIRDNRKRAQTPQRPRTPAKAQTCRIALPTPAKSHWI